MFDALRQSVQRRRKLADEQAEQFDSSILHNYVHETVCGHNMRDDELLRAVDLAERANRLSDETDVDELDQAAFDAAEAVNDPIDILVALRVLEACETLLEHADGWSDQFSEDEIAHAKQEARDWINEYSGQTKVGSA
jgi:hypothetical protein